MSSRAEILRLISQNKPSFVKVPLMPINKAIGRDALVSQFVQTAELIGAKIIFVKDWEMIRKGLEEQKRNNKLLVNTISELGAMDDTINDESSATELEKIDLSFIRGQVAVSENGAIWVDDSNLPNRLLPFICQHLVLVIKAENIVGNMHEAYEKTDTFKTGWGAFIAGPSKTADIEQSLVIGAHGARSLVIYVLTE